MLETQFNFNIQHTMYLNSTLMMSSIGWETTRAQLYCGLCGEEFQQVLVLIYLCLILVRYVFRALYWDSTYNMMLVYWVPWVKLLQNLKLWSVVIWDCIVVQLCLIVSVNFIFCAHYSILALGWNLYLIRCYHTLYIYL